MSFCSINYETLVGLENILGEKYFELGIRDTTLEKICSFTQLLKKKCTCTYMHSVRVGILCKEMGDYLCIDSNALFYAGLLHDIGKSKISTYLLEKKGSWTKSNKKKMESHVYETYNLLKGTFDFTAEVVMWHHKFQLESYPENMPVLLHNYSYKTQELIKQYGRLLAIADVYDALHRDTTHKAHGRYLSSSEIKDEMLLSNPDMVDLIEELYSAHVFESDIYADLQIHS
jgi:putative nucleotidyltransferase with HDIG domain